MVCNRTLVLVTCRTTAPIIHWALCSLVRSLTISPSTSMALRCQAGIFNHPMAAIGHSRSTNLCTCFKSSFGGSLFIFFASVGQQLDAPSASATPSATSKSVGFNAGTKDKPQMAILWSLASLLLTVLFWA